MKVIVITGGVLSGLGKGVLTASIAALLQKDYKLICIKCDGYLNADPGTMNPVEHGEVYVLEDGGEVDMDFGHYERFANLLAKKSWNITMGKIYKQILEDERKGKFLGKTVQLIPHATDEIKRQIHDVSSLEKADIALIEIGGTIGDMENELFIESMRQLRADLGRNNVMFFHLTYVPFISGSRELKSKPTQSSVKTLNQAGIYPDAIICRSSDEIDEEIRKKIALYCNVSESDVFSNPDQENIYNIPHSLQKQGVLKLIEERLNIKSSGLDQKTKDFYNALKTLDGIGGGAGGGGGGKSSGGAVGGGAEIGGGGRGEAGGGKSGRGTGEAGGGKIGGKSRGGGGASDGGAGGSKTGGDGGAEIGGGDGGDGTGGGKTSGTGGGKSSGGEAGGKAGGDGDGAEIGGDGIISKSGGKSGGKTSGGEVGGGKSGDGEAGGGVENAEKTSGGVGGDGKTESHASKTTEKTGGGKSGDGGGETHRHSHNRPKINIALCGKYTYLEDSYASIKEALLHARVNIFLKKKMEMDYAIDFIDSEQITFDNVEEKLKDFDCIIIPGGFGSRGVEGKITITNYARKNDIPFLGICLGMQVAVVEYARYVCGLKDAVTEEMETDSEKGISQKEISRQNIDPVITLLPSQRDVLYKGGTMRLGAHEVLLKKNSTLNALFKKEIIKERFRHRYEVNPKYVDLLEKNGLLFSGSTLDGSIKLMCECPDKTFFIGTQSHPELNSTPLHPSSLFLAFLEKTLEKKIKGVKTQGAI